MRRVRVQVKAEVMLLARNGEQLLLTLIIPVLLLAFFGSVDVLPSAGMEPIEFLLPGVLALAIMSSAMVSLGIATGFERSYLVLKRLGATPLTRSELVVAKILSVCAVEVVQLLVLVALALPLGWTRSDVRIVSVLAAIALGTSAFAGIGILLAGSLRAEVNLAAQNGVYLVLLLLGGMVIPRSSLPGVLADVSAVLPSSALSTVLRGSLSGVSVSTGVWAVLICWAVLAPAVAARRFRWV